MEYANGTYLTPGPGPFSWGMIDGAALCTDGKVRRVRFGSGIADTFFSIPARVNANGKTVSGYVTVETMQGYSTPTDDDPAVVKFYAVKYGRNYESLPNE